MKEENIEGRLYSVPYRREVKLPRNMLANWNVSENELLIIRRLLAGFNLRFVSRDEKIVSWWSVPLENGSRAVEDCGSDLDTAKGMCRRHILEIRSSCRGGSYFLPVGICQHMVYVEEILEGGKKCKVQAWSKTTRGNLIRCGHIIITRGQKVESMSFSESCIDSFSYEEM